MVIRLIGSAAMDAKAFVPIIRIAFDLFHLLTLLSLIALLHRQIDAAHEHLPGEDIDISGLGKVGQARLKPRTKCVEPFTIVQIRDISQVP